MMGSDSKTLEQLGKAEKYVYQRAKSSFEKHAKNCKHQYIGPSGEKKCSHQRGGRNCRFELCPLLEKEEKYGY
ncbi:hypothetical protein AKJ57_05350 [candidate division MSBL1 archaeon SCGC-AAA259A05]|uniref:Uncharacterized protein n=1 Tax=candidate division MSBL1 archaeon SCGC-AAA259A05 TaxID=1698259 RepID=A0A133U5E0_9EURY|nr:hypothetical protein AKJ57_05350 [candidate division MSBL1 archaeon SCGC-AAA259A05]